MILEIFFVIILYISCKFNIHFSLDYINLLISLFILLFSSYIILKKIKLYKLFSRILSILLYLIIIFLLTLVFLKYIFDSPMLTRKVYRDEFKKNNELLRVVSYDDGGFSGPTYVIYEKNMNIGLICETIIKVDDSFYASFNLEDIYDELTYDNSFCKYKSSPLNK
ncbi:MAG TPA: hypothetical protein IAC20_00535 [Candidatus Faecisoma merdavium]|nr:hypothetical protein [Candidatus Faecisoma merdavium]